MTKPAFSSPYIENEQQERIYQLAKRRRDTAIRRAEAKRERQGQAELTRHNRRLRIISDVCEHTKRLAQEEYEASEMMAFSTASGSAEKA